MYYFKNYTFKKKKNKNYTFGVILKNSLPNPRP